MCVAHTLDHTCTVGAQIFHYVRSRELRAVTLLGRAFKYQLVRVCLSCCIPVHFPD